MRPRLAALDLAEDPAAWAGLGFAVEDGTCVIGTTLVRLTGGDGGITGWGLDGAPSAVDGLPEAQPATATAQEHPNGATVIDHVVVRTPDFARTIAALEAAGLELRRTRDASPTVRQGFLPLADALVEVVGPTEPEGDGPAALWGLVVVVPDVDALTSPHFGSPRDAVQPGRRIVTVRADASGIRTPLAFLTPR
jgi:hypothetical protein